MSRIPFSTKVLESNYNFEKYLASSEAIEYLREEAKKPYVTGDAKLGALSVVWVTATLPFRLYGTLFLKAMGTLIYYATPFRKQAMDLLVLSVRQDNYVAMVFSNYIFGFYSNVLVDTLNTYSFDAQEIYSHTPIDLGDPRIDEEVSGHFFKTYIDAKGRLNFGQLIGQCAGTCEWMAYLYHETKDDFADPEHHLVALTKLVSDGAPREAALMQLAQIDRPPYLGLSKLFVEEIEAPTAQKVQELFEGLGPGFYSVSTLRHRMNLAVTSRHTYLIEPNYGLVKQTPEQLSKSFTNYSAVRVCLIS